MSFRFGLVAALFVAWLGAGSAVTLANWEGQLVSPGLERLYFTTRIAEHEADYLHALRDRHLGCETLAYRDPGIVFFGDSHSYAGWDYAQLQAGLGIVVGNCALSGAFPENLPELVAAIRRTALPVRFIVIGVSPRMFWDVPERADRIARARAQIADVGAPMENLVTLASGEWRQVDAFPPVAESELERMAKLGAEVDTLSPATVDDFLARHEASMYATQWWRDYAAAGTGYPGIADVVDRACQAVTAAGIELAVVYIPESAWLTRQYSAEQQAQFNAVVDRFRQCASFVDIAAFPDGGDNRWYINRYLVEDYPYAAWDDFTLLDAWMAADETQRRWQFFDPDHLSPYGARAFTASMLPGLSGWIDGE